MTSLPNLPVPEGGILSFQCNICGAPCQFRLDELDRETISCGRCQSTPRKRTIIHLLAEELLHQDIALSEFPTDKRIQGLGMSDAQSYAVQLARKFSYQNTYLHRPPLFDIMAELSPEQLTTFDFIISSEVFEHVSPPVDRAFKNVFRMLKSGGLFILTAPFTKEAETVEHFPDLYDYSVIKVDGKPVLRNVTRRGEVQEFDRLVFHGGLGATVEMRVFSEADILRRMSLAGFTDIRVHGESCLRHGIWWPSKWSLPISARKPL